MKRVTVSKSAGDVEIKYCSCANDYQDKKYGPGRRVHNPLAKGGTRCSVCGAKK